MGLKRKSPTWSAETNAKRAETHKKKWADPAYVEERKQRSVAFWAERGLTPRDAFHSIKKRQCRHCQSDFGINDAPTRKWCKTCCPNQLALGRLRMYKMSQPEFDAMYAAQTGLCKLCDVPIQMSTKQGGLTHDHDHKTGKVRGLLCGRCNRNLGVVERDAAWLKRAIDYLKEHST